MSVYLSISHCGSTIVDLLPLLEHFPFRAGDEIHSVSTDFGGRVDILLSSGELSDEQRTFLREREYIYSLIKLRKPDVDTEDLSVKLAALNLLRARVNRVNDTIGRLFAPLLDEQAPSREDLQKAEQAIARLVPNLALRYSVGFQSYGLFPCSEKQPRPSELNPQIGQVYTIRFKTAFSFQDDRGYTTAFYPADELIHGVRMTRIEYDPVNASYTKYGLQWEHSFGDDICMRIDMVVSAQTTDFFLG